MLTDTELLDLQARSDFISGVPSPVSGGAGSPIQPASVDLSVGDIALPEASNGPTIVRLGYELQPGHTAIVTTLETLTIPPTHAGIAMPASGPARRGLLMTNPGHVDPGFEGALSFTVINMGREAYQLNQGDTLATMMLFECKTACAEDWRARNASGPAGAMAAIDLLSRDFLDVERRAKKVADDRYRKWSLIVPGLAAFVALLAVLGTAYFTSQQTNAQNARLEDRLNGEATQLRASIASAPTQSDIVRLQAEIARLREIVADLRTSR